MAKYRYDGPGPLEVASLDGKSRELVRPGDVREFADYPSWGPWEPLDEPETDEGDPEPPGPQEASPAAPGAAPAPTLAAPPVKGF
jgi:hypothetical protein